MRLKSILPWLALVVGLLGVVACGVAMAVVWSTASRVSRASTQAFDQIDQTLDKVLEGVDNVQLRVQESKITATDMEQGLKDWTRKKASQQIESRLAIADKTKALSQGLQQANTWVEVSQASFDNIQQALLIGNSLGAPIDVALVDPLIDKLANLQNQLSQATETVDGIHNRVAKTSEGEPSQEKLKQAAQLAFKVVATLGEIDSRLAESSERLSETKVATQQLRARMHAAILTVGLGMILMLIWMAVGQACLCRSGWNARQSSAGAVASD